MSEPNTNMLIFIVVHLLAIIKYTDADDCAVGQEKINGACFYCSEKRISCYYFHSTILTWDNAQANCKTIGSVLTSVKSLEERNEILAFAQKVWTFSSYYTHTSFFWIGGTDELTPTKWSWVTPYGKTPIKYTKDLYSINNANRDYLTLYYTGSMYDRAKTTTLYSICEFQKTVVCPPEYTKIKDQCLLCSNGTDSCYEFVQEKLTWNEAQTSCINKNALLASIESKEENDEVVEMIQKYSFEGWYWLGGSDSINENQWHWRTHGGNIPFTFTNWAENFPIGFTSDDDYLIQVVKISDSYWRDDSNSDNKSSVCEYKKSSLDQIPNKGGNEFYSGCDDAAWTDTNDTNCYVELKSCQDDEFVVQLTARDYPMFRSKSRAYCLSTKSGKKEKIDLVDTTNEFQLTIISFDKAKQEGVMYSIQCFIKYGGETFITQKDASFTLLCNKNETLSNNVITIETSFSVTDYAEDFNVDSTDGTDPTARLKICRKEEFDLNSNCSIGIPNLGDMYCLGLYSEDDIQDIQIAFMVFSDASNANLKLNVYENCERLTDSEEVKAFSEPNVLDYKDDCSGRAKLQNCPKHRFECFRIFTFVGSDVINLKIGFKKTNSKNVKAKCQTTTRKRRAVGGYSYDWMSQNITIRRPEAQSALTPDSSMISNTVLVAIMACAATFFVATAIGIVCYKMKRADAIV